MQILTNRTLRLLCIAVYGFIGSAFVSSRSKADPIKQYQTNQRGDFLMIGNTVGYDCRSGIPAPVVGTVGSCGTNTNDTSIDVLWKANHPAAGQATANNTIVPDQAGSIATLNIPVGAQVSYARLYWAAARKSTESVANTAVTFSRPSGFTQSITAQNTNSISGASGTPGKVYQASAEVTNLVKTQGSGLYQVSGIPAINPVDQNVEVNFVAWTLVVFYETNSGPTRNLTLFEGLDEVRSGRPATVTLSGFLVPSAAFDAKLGVVAYEGDNSIPGDKMSFRAAHDTVFHEISDGTVVGQTDNFFNATRMWLGSPISVVGDLPQMSGAPGSMNGYDMDVVDVKNYLIAGDTSATITATSTQDIYYLGMFVTSISTFEPVVKDVLKTYEDLNTTDNIIRRGHKVEYTISNIHNTGSDDTIHTILEDILPAEVTYFPGSLCVITGLNGNTCEPLTDAAGDDVGEYDATTNKIRVYLGEGATPTLGGTLHPDGAPISVKFSVVVKSDVSGLVSNQGTVQFEGKKASQAGLPGKKVKTGNGIEPEAPTVFNVTVCNYSFNDCPEESPICDLTAQSGRCTSACRTDDDCKNLPGGQWVCRKKSVPDEGEYTPQICMPRTDLVLTVDASTVSRENEVVYSIHVTNEGQYVAPGALMMYDIPTNAQIEGIDGGADWNCIEQGTQIVCQAMRQLPVGEVSSVLIRILGPKNEKTMPFHASVASIGIEDFNLANNEVSFVTPLWTYGLSGGGLGGCTMIMESRTSSKEIGAWVALFAACVALLAWRTAKLRRSSLRKEI